MSTRDVSGPTEGSEDRTGSPVAGEGRPLAARMRPASLDEFVGQDHLLGPGKLLRRAIETDRLGSILLWGPPGCGKTTLARLVASTTRSAFESLNAVLAGVKDIREVIDRAKERLAPSLLRAPQKTILFVDEVHRFNKAQQDALLPHVESGTITLIGATTENPYFEVIKPLVSRSRVFELHRLEERDLLRILRAALDDRSRGYGAIPIRVSDDALAHIVRMAQGDARNALNALELAVETRRSILESRRQAAPQSHDTPVEIDLTVAEEAVQHCALLYDKDGDAHYDMSSALIKSLRGSDVDAALFWLARMLASGEDPRFVARRLVIFASEDVGMAEPLALLVATAAARAVEFVGMPECQYNLAHACIHLATAPKSNSTKGYFEALREVRAGAVADVPDHLKDPSRDRKGLGHGAGYQYPHAFEGHWVPQQYLPWSLQGKEFYQPTEQGYERKIKERVERLRRAQVEGRSHDRPEGAE